MSPAELLAVNFPDLARGPFNSEGVVRRLARVAQLEAGRRVLDLSSAPAGLAGLLLAQEYGCSVLVGTRQESERAALLERIQALGLGARAEVRTLDPATLQLADVGGKELDAIVLLGRVLHPLSAVLARLRPLLTPHGRLGLLYPVRVGRHVPEAVLELWRQRLGESLRLPHELLSELERSGFEPETAESLQAPDLEALYQQAEPHLQSLGEEQAQRLREEVALHRAHGERLGASYALLVGRRKEPGEKPFLTRDRG